MSLNQSNAISMVSGIARWWVKKWFVPCVSTLNSSSMELPGVCVQDSAPAQRRIIVEAGWGNTLSWIHTRTQAFSFFFFSFFLSLCHMRISAFWGQERLTDRSISKRYLKSDIVSWVEKSSTSRVIHVHRILWSSENALHERFIACSGDGVCMKTLQLIAKR